MSHLALFLLLMAGTQLPAPVGVEPSPLEQPVLDDLCALGRQISRLPPCLAADECASFRLWRQALGAPGPRFLPPSPSRLPRLAGPERPRRRRGLRIDDPEIQRLLTAHCPATVVAEAPARQ